MIFRTPDWGDFVQPCLQRKFAYTAPRTRRLPGAYGQ